MSIHLTTKHPIINEHSLLRMVAEALGELHAEGRAHGAVSGQVLREWLTSAGDALDIERFRASAKPQEQLNDNAIAEDIVAFAEIAISLIEGEQGAPNQPFQPELHLGKKWPEGFLHILAKIRNGGASTDVSTVALIEVLHPETTDEDPAGDTTLTESEVSASTPQSASPTSPNSECNASVHQPAISLTLRNGTVGKPYKVEAGVLANAIAKERGDDPARALISHLQLPKNCGLLFDRNTGAITGTPTRTFEGELNLDYVPCEHGTSVPFTIKLLINPDPASLWKDLPPPADAPYPKPDTDHFQSQFEAFQVIAASRRGRAHANRGEFRDDDYAIGFAPDSGWLVVAVADGAGSARYARRGSQIACQVACKRLVAELNSATHNLAEAAQQRHQDWAHPDVASALSRILYGAALDAHYKLQDEVKQPSEPLSEPATLRNYDTTLILLVIKKTESGWVTATFAIGDGGVGLLPSSGDGFPLTRPEGGEHAGQTTFLTLPSSLRDDEESLASHFHFALVPEFVGILMMTDGITDPKFPSDAAFSDPVFWSALWMELKPVLATGSGEELLEWMNFFSPGNHDDRTLVAILPNSVAALS